MSQIRCQMEELLLYVTSDIETDKVSMEVPATSAGVVEEIRVAAGEVAPVGAVVAVLSGAAGATTAARKTPNAVPAPAPIAPSSSITAPRPPSPAASEPPVR